MHPVLFKIGPLTIYTYGTMVALGIIIGLFLAVKQARKENINPGKIIDLFFWLLVSGFAGARVFYILVEWKTFLQNPIKIIFAREGFVFYGGFIFAYLAAFWYVKKNKLQTWQVADILAPPAAIAQAIGRIGCFFYGCCYGEIPLGKITIPTQLVESFALFIIFCILIAIRKYKKFHGEIFWLYVLLYAIIRFITEFFRQDPRGSIWIFSTSQFIAIIMAVAAVAMLFKLKVQNAKRKTIA